MKIFLAAFCRAHLAGLPLLNASSQGLIFCGILWPSAERILAGPPLNLRGCIFRDYIETLSPLQSISCRAFFRGILSAGSLLCSSCDALYCSSVGLGHWHCAAAPSETLLLASMRHFVPCCRRASPAESSSKIALRSLSFVRLIGADSGRACCVVFASMLLSTALRFVADRERRRTSYSSRGRAHWIKPIHLPEDTRLPTTTSGIQERGGRLFFF